MSSSSAAFLESEFSAVGTSSSPGPVDSGRIQKALDARAERSIPESPEGEHRRRRKTDVLEAAPAISLEAGRRAALQTTEREYADLVARHRVLARKKVAEELNHSEGLELQLVRWELDRIDDARQGPARELLKAALRPKIELAREITQFVDQLKSAGIVGGRGRGGRR